MPNKNGWPDASKPGVPLNPEKDGIHALLLPHHHIPFGVRWRASDREFFTMNTGSIVTDAVKAIAIYVGQIITPSEAQHRERAAAAAAWMAAREAGAELFDDDRVMVFGTHVATALRALPPPEDAAAALAEVVKRAKEEEREACAAACAAVDTTAFNTDEECLAADEAVGECLAAIRARAEGGE